MLTINLNVKIKYIKHFLSNRIKKSNKKSSEVTIILNIIINVCNTSISFLL